MRDQTRRKQDSFLAGFGEEDSTGKFKYKIGVLLLTLVQSIEPGNREVLTYWGAFKPLYRPNTRSGTVYFRRASRAQLGTMEPSGGNNIFPISEQRYSLRLFN